MQDQVADAPTESSGWSSSPKQTINNSLVGGTGNYMAASGNSAVDATVIGTTGTISRHSQLGVTPPSTVNVAFSDGQTIRQVTVQLSGPAAGPGC